jgi:DNA-binding transcriptional MerR regulator
MNVFTIKDLENLSGIKAHTIRIWEQRYSFLNPQRSETNIRYYSNDELQTILNIALLNKYGYKISQIDKMSTGEISDKILGLCEVEAKREKLVNELIHCMVKVDMNAFELLLTKYIKSKGIEQAIVQILFPFLERIGILWVTNHINPAQEHLVSNLIRQKLIVGIDSISNPVSPGKTALLFLPEGEHHELGLLFIHYLLKRNGHGVLYLGTNVPLKDLVYVATMQNPDFLYAHLTSVADSFSFDKFLTNLHGVMPNRKVVVSGVLTQTYKRKIPSGFSFKKSLSEVEEYISSL